MNEFYWKILTWILGTLAILIPAVAFIERAHKRENKKNLLSKEKSPKNPHNQESNK